MGLGRMQLEHEQIAAETGTRRQLTVEEQMNEDLQTTQSRLQRAEDRERVEAHVQEIKRSFYCAVCVTALCQLLVTCMMPPLFCTRFKRG